MLYPIIPTLYNKFVCPECKGSNISAKDILFQGVHILVEFECRKCRKVFLSDLPISQALATPYTIDKTFSHVYGEPRAMGWFGKPLLHSLQNPVVDTIDFKVEKIKRAKKAIIINCLDYLYGHSLLKLLNAEFYLRNSNKKGIILVIPQALRWLVPDVVAEVWTVGISFLQANNFYPDLDANIKRELERFDSVDVAGTIPHPNDFSIQNFTGVSQHDFSSSSFRVTYIWRDDRLWIKNDLLSQALHVSPGIRAPFRYVQNFRVRYLFSLIRKHFPNAKFTVAGFGRSTSFPDWIDDERYVDFPPEIERKLCSVYSESRLVIGMHGSSLLLPSAHAGITFDLMPHIRWGNIAQDIIFQENNLRHSMFRYRFLPAGISLRDLSVIAVSSLNNFPAYKNLMDDSPLYKKSMAPEKR